MCQPIGPAVQLPIRQLLRFEHDGDGVRRSLHLRLKELMNTQIPLTIRLGTVPLHQQLLPLGFGQERQVRKALLGIRDDGFQQGLKIRQHPGNRARLKQINVVHECGRQLLLGVHNLQGQIKVSRLAVPLDRAQGQARQLQRSQRSILQCEHDLKERIAAQVPLQVQFLDEPIKGQILMAIRTQTHLPHPPQELPKTGIAGKVRPQNQCVDEESDQPFGLHPVTVGDRRTDDKVVLTRVAIQQNLERRQHCHEEGDTFLATKRFEPILQGLGQHQRLVRTPESLHRWSGEVRGQINQSRGTSQPLLPIGNLCFQDFTLQPLPLPLGEVRILDGQRQQW